MKLPSAFRRFLLVSCLVAGPTPALAETVSREITVDPAGVRVIVENGLTQIRVSGAGPGLGDAAPALPLLGVHLPLPAGTRPVEARLVPLETTALPGVHRLPRGETAPSGLLLPYEGDDDRLLPEDPVATVRAGRLRGHELAVVGVAPVRWMPSTGELRLTTRFRIEVDLAPALATGDPFVPLRETESGARTFGAAFRRLTGEPTSPRNERVATPSVNSGAPFAPGFRPTVEGSPVDMVIITPASQASQYQRLADFKTAVGLATVVRTIEWIQATYPHGADLQETIRLFIRDAAARWGTAWILLGGDTGAVPARQAYSTYHAGEYIPCDLYYSDLDGNWNADGDAVFGEGALGLGAPGDAVDLYPDVWVGRLPSNTLAEAEVLVDKTLLYQQSPPLGYQRDMLFLAEVLFPEDWSPGKSVGLDGAIFADAAKDSLLPQHRAVRLYENNTAWPGSLLETKPVVLDSVNAGFHLIQHVGHGFINTMAVGQGNQTLSNADADAFTNGSELSVLYSVNCTSSAFDYNSIAERFMLNPNGGAVASIGTTEVDFPTTASLYQQEFYHLLFRSGVTALGEALALSRVPYVASSVYDSPQRWTQFSLVYLGDPSLEFWLNVPTTLTVTYPAVAVLGQNAFTVTVKRGLTPVSGARVALEKRGDTYATGFTALNGQVTLPFHPDSVGTFTVGVWTGSDLPHQGTSVVAPPQAPYLFARAQTITDTVGGQTSGNGDGRMDAGETVLLRLTLENSGCVTATGVSATLSTSDPYLTVLDPLSAFQDVPVGASRLASDGMRLGILRAAPDRHEAHATLNVTTATGSFQEDVILYVHAPILEYRLQAVRDSVGNGNNNNVIAANEDFVIVPRIRNAGLGNLRGGSLRLRSTDPAVTITDSTATLGTVASGAIMVNLTDGLRARFSDVTSPHQLLLVVKDAYGEVFSRRLDIAPPAPVGSLFALGHATSVALSWAPAPEPDLWGYAVYRATAFGGPYTRVNTWTVERTAAFEDAGLPGLSRYYYRVAPLDSSGNQGPLSVTLSATTSLPLHPGWPVETGTVTPSGITLADLDATPGLEVAAGGKEILVLTPGGGDFVDGDGEAQTRGFITDSGGMRFWGAPAIGDVDEDGDLEIASIGFDDAKLYLIDAAGNPLPGWPKNTNVFNLPDPNPIGSVTLGDIDADGDLEIFASVGRAILAWHHTGIELKDGDANPATQGVLAATGSIYSYGTPCVANIDADPYRELIVGMRDGKLYVFRHDGTAYPGFPFTAGGDIAMGIAVGDINLDGKPEIVFGASNGIPGTGQLYAIRSDLTSAPGFPEPIPLAEDWDSSPALGDVSGDGAPDVAIGGSDGKVYVVSGATGSVLSGFPVNLVDAVGAPVPTRSSPALADVDGNGSIDLVIGDRDGRLHAFAPNGTLLPGFPIQTGNRITGGPAIGDIDGDGLTEIAALSEDQFIYVWDTPWTFNPARAPWPMFQGNPRHTGFLGDAGYTGAVTGIAPVTPVLPQNFPNPFRATTTIRFRIPAGSGTQPVSLRIYDLSGRVVRTVLDEARGPGEHEASWDGRDAGGRPVAAGIYAYRLRVGDRALARTLVLLPR